MTFELDEFLRFLLGTLLHVPQEGQFFFLFFAKRIAEFAVRSRFEFVEQLGLFYFICLFQSLLFPTAVRVVPGVRNDGGVLALLVLQLRGLAKEEFVLQALLAALGDCILEPLLVRLILDDFWFC